MTRQEWHAKLDAVLDYVGHNDTTQMRWGTATLEIKFESGKEVITIKERETHKPNKGA